MADVFVSYARPNASIAKRIASALRKRGYEIWFDEKLPAHRDYSEVIATELDHAAAVLVLWSEAATQSQWVRSEANRARETGRLVQARLDDARLPMPFDQIQCADLRNWPGKNNGQWQAVLSSIASLVDGEPCDRTGQDCSTVSSLELVDRRRLLVTGGAATGLAAAVFAGWRLFLNKRQSSPEAQLLLQKGLDALQSNDAFDTTDRGTTMQAVALLNEATKADPNSATAWGGLALAYAVRKRASPISEREGLNNRARSAASAALELDADEPRALAALRLLEPVYRNWLSAERRGREALKAHPNHPILVFTLADVLASVGRWREAADLSLKFDRTKFLIPGADRKVIINLWSAGDLQAADEAVKVAVEHWPDHPQIWRTRLGYLMFSGRASEALELLHNNAQRPPNIGANFVDVARATAEALTGNGNAASAVRTNLDYVKANPSAGLQVAQACAALGARATALALIQGYYFSENEWSRLAPPGGDEDRLTAPLFQPPMRNVWTEAGFDRLLERTGLNAYWRKSRTMPDYRRSA